MEEKSRQSEFYFFALNLFARQDKTYMFSNLGSGSTF